MTTGHAHEALRAANAARLGAVELRARIADAGRVDGAVLAADTVARGDSPQRFGQLLRALPNVGGVRSLAMLSRAGLRPDMRVDSPRVTDRQRGRLVDEILAYAYPQRT
jgi:hypothetical protein